MPCQLTPLQVHGSVSQRIPYINSFALRIRYLIAGTKYVTFRCLVFLIYAETNLGSRGPTLFADLCPFMVPRPGAVAISVPSILCAHWGPVIL
jgi:hypothetical protein